MANDIHNFFKTIEFFIVILDLLKSLANRKNFPVLKINSHEFPEDARRAYHVQLLQRL